MAKIIVKDKNFIIISVKENNCISLTDIVKYKRDGSATVIGNWL